MTIEPGPNTTPRDLARGISTTVLRRLDLASATAQARKAAPSVEELSGPIALGAATRELLTSEGVSVDYLATLALTYKTVSDSGEKAPISWLSTTIGRRPETIKDHLKRARREGLLTTIAGKAGGDLTEKAKVVLAKLNLPDGQSTFQGR